MQRISTFLFSLFLVSVLTAQEPCSQLNYHAFKAESLQGTYTDLDTLGTEFNVSNLDDGISAPQEIGFTFEYHCQAFTQFIFNTNGFIKLGAETNPKTNLFFSSAQSTSGGVFSNADSNNVNLIVVFNNDIETVNPDPDFRMHTSGTAPYRVCTIQWKNMQEWSSDPATKQFIDMDFQLKLYETTNVIEFVYGAWTASANPSNYKTGACGLKGISADDDQLLVVVKSSAAHWNNVTFHNGNYASNESFNFGNPPDRPGPKSGQTYRFTPTYYNDMTIRQVYSLGNASSYYSSPQTISANVRNSGYTPQTNVPVFLDISGANSFRDTQYIAQLAFNENSFITFPGYAPTENGQTDIRISIGDDDSSADNNVTSTQQVTDLELNYSTNSPPARGYGFLAGVQGIYYVKFPVHGTAGVHAVNAYISGDTASIGKTIFAIVLNAGGQVVARSDNYILQESDLDTWRSFTFPETPVLAYTSFYAGIGLTSSLTRYSPLGVQNETPMIPGTYYTSLITGNGLTEMNPATFAYRFMIGATLEGTQPFAGPVTGDTSICAFGMANITIQEYTGFVSWQASPDGISNWQALQQDAGSTQGSYITPPLTNSTYYRAAVFQPGFGFTFSNVVLVEVIPPTPAITASGDAINSSATEGNQWYNQNGIIPGATGQNFLALEPGTYYVVVTTGDCISAPSNAIDILTVATHEVGGDSRFKIYPNPVGDALSVEVSDLSEQVSYAIINIHGQTIQKGTISPESTISLDGMAPGLYTIILQCADILTRLPFVKQ